MHGSPSLDPVGSPRYISAVGSRSEVPFAVEEVRWLRAGTGTQTRTNSSTAVNAEPRLPLRVHNRTFRGPQPFTPVRPGHRLQPHLDERD
jgi:hypothetical protein